MAPVLFYSELQLAETLTINAQPTARPPSCPYCKGWLAAATSFAEIYEHQMRLEFGLCLFCGWWDVVYREDGMMSYHEEESYYRSRLASASDQVVSAITEAALVNRVAWNADSLYSCTPRETEEFVASVFRSVLDCKIELTPQTRDGGYDLIGFDSSGGPFIVEVKRYREGRRVGVSLVRQLIGVMYVNQIEHSIVVTTSSFTRDARAAAAAVESSSGLKLELRDMADIRAWLKLSFRNHFDLERLDRQVRSMAYQGNQGIVSFPRIFHRNGVDYDFQDVQLKAHPR
jgi:hypothetical protein